VSYGVVEDVGDTNRIECAVCGADLSKKIKGLRNDVR
jgi:hypothetical protein